MLLARLGGERLLAQSALLELAFLRRRSLAFARRSLQRARREPSRGPKAGKDMGDGYQIAGYTLTSRIPEDMDVAAVEALLNRRLDAKSRKAYEEADALQAEALGLGLLVNDRRKTCNAA